MIDKALEKEGIPIPPETNNAIKNNKGKELNDDNDDESSSYSDFEED